MSIFIQYMYLLSLFLKEVHEIIPGVANHILITWILIIVFILMQLSNKFLFKLEVGFSCLILILVAFLSFMFFEIHQLTGLFYFFMFSYVSYVSVRYFSWNNILNIYFNLCLLFGVIAIFQEVLHLSGVDISFFKDVVNVENITTTGVALRAFSLTAEPAHFATLILPAVLISLINILNINSLDIKINTVSRWKCLIIIISYFLSFSTVAILYLLVFVILLVLFKASSFKVYGALLVIVPLFILMSQTEAVSQRLSSLDEILIADKETNSSAFAIQSNLLVMNEVLNISPLIGGGPFSHELNYNKLISNIYYVDDNFRYLNTRDAASLYIRVASEFGAIGFLMLIGYIVLTLFNAKKNNDYLMFIFIVSFICYGLRMGNYDTPILWFMVAYISKIKNLNNSY